MRFLGYLTVFSIKNRVFIGLFAVCTKARQKFLKKSKNFP